MTAQESEVAKLINYAGASMKPDAGGGEGVALLGFQRAEENIHAIGIQTGTASLTPSLTLGEFPHVPPVVGQSKAKL